MCATYSPRDPVGEYWRRELSLRGLRVLVEGLPPDSAMHRKYAQSQGWTTSDHLLASLIDAIQSLFNLTLAANSEEGKYEPPKPIARPGDAERQAAADAAERRRIAHAKTVVAGLLSQLFPS